MTVWTVGCDESTKEGCAEVDLPRPDMLVYIAPMTNPEGVDAVRVAIVDADAVDADRIEYLDFEAARELLIDDDETFELLDETNLPTQFSVFALPCRDDELPAVRDLLEMAPSVQRVIVAAEAGF